LSLFLYAVILRACDFFTSAVILSNAKDLRISLLSLPCFCCCLALPTPSKTRHSERSEESLYFVLAVVPLVVIPAENLLVPFGRCLFHALILTLERSEGEGPPQLGYRAKLDRLPSIRRDKNSHPPLYTMNPVRNHARVSPHRVPVLQIRAARRVPQKGSALIRTIVPRSAQNVLNECVGLNSTIDIRSLCFDGLRTIRSRSYRTHTAQPKAS
jgi:hypothetical protein